MSGVAAPDLAAYFREARRWDEDRLAEARRSRRVAWILAGASGALCLAAVGALASLAPLKRVEPYVVRVDQATGAVEVMTALKDPRALAANEAVSKYFLAQYVRAREGWLPAAAEANFRLVSLMSAPAEQQRWAEAFRPTNPQSPQVALGPGGEAQVDVLAVSFLSPQAASVRFRRAVRQGDQPVETGDFIATLAFTYARAPMAEADRLRNPLGFQVTSYRADPEAIR